jgi:hypothetical protein
MEKKSIKILYLLLLSLYFCIISAELLCAQSLETPNTSRIRAQIDSVVSSLDIEVASVCFKVVDNLHDNTSTTTSCAISRKSFTMHNGFLQFEDSFYNLDKLLFFRIEKDTRTKKPYLEFYFQYY